MLELVRQMPSVGVNTYQFNDMTDFDIDVVPGVVWDELNNFNSDMYDNKLTIEAKPEKRCIMISQEDKENELNNLQVKLKFFNLAEEAEEGDKPRLRL